MTAIVNKRKPLTVRTFTPPSPTVKATVAKPQLTPEEKAATQAATQERQRIEQQAAKLRRDEAKLKRREVNYPIFELLGEKWPLLFGREAVTVPLKKKIHRDIIAAFPEYPQQAIRGAFVHYFNLVKKQYLKAVAAGGPRFDLDGHECGTVTEEEQERARGELAETKGRI